MSDEAAAEGSAGIDRVIEQYDDWRGETLAHVRALIVQAVPGVVEEIKWRKASNPLGVPVWSSNGIICTGETYKDKVKLTFMSGAAIADPAGVFNAGLDSKTRRVLDLADGDAVDADAFKALVSAAAEHNASSS